MSFNLHFETLGLLRFCGRTAGHPQSSSSFRHRRHLPHPRRHRRMRAVSSFAALRRAYPRRPRLCNRCRFPNISGSLIANAKLTAGQRVAFGGERRYLLKPVRLYSASPPAGRLRHGGAAGVPLCYTTVAFGVLIGHQVVSKDFFGPDNPVSGTNSARRR